MKNLSLLILLILFPVLFCLAQNEPIQIVLGTYHLSGAAPDPIKVSGDAILGAKRQKEIDEIVTQLAKFNPQHIFIERTEKWDSAFQNVYQEYKQGKVPENRNFTAEKASTETYKTLSELNVQFMDSIPLLPLKESLFRLNSEQYRKFTYYGNVLHYMDKNPEDIGVEWSHTQNFRNMNIYQNILKHITEKTERCLVIYGAGHIQALRECFESNPRFEIVEVSEVLE